VTKKPHIKIPNEIRKGEIIQIKTLVAHEMENGLRRDQAGKLVPRKIINHFACTFNGKPVFACDLEPAAAANPYLVFSVQVEESGIFNFSWIDDDGTTISAEETIAVT
jgi:sulfur-oxidizing protein SoxZ